MIHIDLNISDVNTLVLYEACALKKRGRISKYLHESLCRVNHHIYSCGSIQPFFNPFPNDIFWILPKDNFRFDEIGGKIQNRVENTVGKGEIARYEQFLLFLQCFQKTYTADT